MTTRAWAKWYFKDWITDTLDLSLPLTGAFLTAVNLIMSNGGPIEDDGKWIAKVCGCSSRMWRKLCDDLIRRGKLLRTPDGKLTSLKVESVLADGWEEHAKFVNSGRKGGRNAAEKRQMTANVNALVEKGLPARQKIEDKNHQDARACAHVETMIQDSVEEAASSAPEVAIVMAVASQEPEPAPPAAFDPDDIDQCLAAYFGSQPPSDQATPSAGSSCDPAPAAAGEAVPSQPPPRAAAQMPPLLAAAPPHDQEESPVDPWNRRPVIKLSVLDPLSQWAKIVGPNELGISKRSMNGEKEPIINGQRLRRAAEVVVEIGKLDPQSFRTDWTPLAGLLRQYNAEEIIMPAFERVVRRKSWHPEKVRSAAYIATAICNELASAFLEVA